jgi:DNA-binding LacI/PurR family transcriptional regulator
MTRVSDPAPSARRPTLHDVAAAAGLSHQTASRFFRDPESLRPETRARVESAVNDLGYRPNLVARSMRTRRSGRIALVVSAISTNPARTIAGADAAAAALGFAVEVVGVADDLDARTARVAELAAMGTVDGIVCLAPIDAAVVERIGSSTVVITEEAFDDAMRSTGPMADASAMRELVEGLADLGHRRFLHLAGPADYASARARVKVYLESVEGLGLRSDGVIATAWDAESARAAILALDVHDRPTAVAAANDLVAAGAVRGALERGWRVPDDLSVTGWDDAPLGRYLSPALTTVTQDFERVGAQAVSDLIARIRGEDAPSPAGAPLHAVVWRESTGPAPES